MCVSPQCLQAVPGAGAPSAGGGPAVLQLQVRDLLEDTRADEGEHCQCAICSAHRRVGAWHPLCVSLSSEFVGRGQNYSKNEGGSGVLLMI